MDVIDNCNQTIFFLTSTSHRGSALKAESLPLVDSRWWAQIHIALVDLTILSFARFSFNSSWIWVSILWGTLCPWPISIMQIICLTKAKQPNINYFWCALVTLPFTSLKIIPYLKNSVENEPLMGFGLMPDHYQVIYLLLQKFLIQWQELGGGIAVINLTIWSLM